ncbi:hypothetical protein FO440_19120 [Mucilaginibacter corticis]|uniref:Uncharacterized protein n=1 Tax=Mucilaginibacter corticis TaxID=2597670 RepID=A0A556MFC1_9SPHI|nr:hypothetical protein [Mucilaginibacter corticis]TSJ38626.1 hypothetical protein FO440_19120 [Mucilaginibacter corticis]
MIKKIWDALFTKSELLQDIYLIAQLNDKVMPIDRGEIYEDPLDSFLKLNFYGEVTGGGTQLTVNNEIAYCDVEIKLNKEPTGLIISDIIRKIENLGAPKGSKLIIEKTGEKIPFGKLEGLAIYLDGINLSDEVYKNSDTEALALNIRKLIGINDDIIRYSQGNTETALYFYSTSFEDMKSKISNFIATEPECENSRIVQIA